MYFATKILHIPDTGISDVSLYYILTLNYYYNMDHNQFEETITLSQAKALIKTLAKDQSLLLLSPPGVGKSEVVTQVANEAGLRVRSLLGTQIAPEDVSGVPHIKGERSVFCPPRVLLPEDPEPFCLFLDELPATAPDVQKAFYSILLERRIGEHNLPKDTWVVAAGNRVADKALVRAMSSALINRVVILNIRVDIKEWLIWADQNGIRDEIKAFIVFSPGSLIREIPASPVPFSTPRSWTLLSRAMDEMEAAGVLNRETLRAVSFGRLSANDAAVFCAMVENEIEDLHSPHYYINNPSKLPGDETERWFVLNCIRSAVKSEILGDISSVTINNFLLKVPQEHRFSLFIGLIEEWGKLGAAEAMLISLKETTGI